MKCYLATKFVSCFQFAALSALVLTGLVWATEAPAQFDTIINVPPDPDPMQIDSDTQLNLFAQGVLGDGFQSGNPDGSSNNVEVNIFDGIAGDFFQAYSGSEINVLGGVVGQDFFGEDTVVNLGGDAILGYSPRFLSSEINIFDDAQTKRWMEFENSTLNVMGGTVGETLWSQFHSYNSTVNFFDGVVGHQGYDGGQYFLLDSSEMNVFGGLVGSGFVGNNSILNVYQGAVLADVYLDYDWQSPGPGDSVLNMHGGTIRRIFLFNNDDSEEMKANLFDGYVPDGIEFGYGDGPKLLVVNGAICGDPKNNWANGGGWGDVRMLEGVLYSLVSTEAGSLDVFGGTLELWEISNSFVDFYGSEFQLFDIDSGQLILDITPLMQFGVPYLLQDRDVVLKGVFADGGAFEYELNTGFPGRFDPDTFHLHLTESVEPDSLEVFRGMQVAGELADLSFSDDQRMTFRPGITLNSSEPPVWLIIENQSPTSVPTNLRLMLESHASTPNIFQQVEIWNWSTGKYEQVASANTSVFTDRTRIVDLTDDIADYMEPGTARVRTRAGWFATGIVLAFPWQINVDQVALSIN